MNQIIYRVSKWGWDGVWGGQNVFSREKKSSILRLHGETSSREKIELWHKELEKERIERNTR
jgi:hypothetical protein